MTIVGLVRRQEHRVDGFRGTSSPSCLSDGPQPSHNGPVLTGVGHGRSVTDPLAFVAVRGGIPTEMAPARGMDDPTGDEPKNIN